METEAQSHDRDLEREANDRRFRLVLFVVAEMLCTGVLVACVVLLV